MAALLFVVAGHSEAMVGSVNVGWAYVVQLTLHAVGRFAVPMFVVLAGYRLGPRLVRERGLIAAWHYVRRLLVMFAAASAFYWAFDLAKMVRRHGLSAGVAAFGQREIADLAAFRMPRIHLAFLLLLTVTVAFAAITIGRARIRTFVGIAFVLGVGSAIASAYGPTLGLPDSYAGVARFLDYPMYFAIGLMLAIAPPLPRQLWLGTTLFVAGALLSTLEMHWLGAHELTVPFSMGSVMGTLLVTGGAAMLAVRDGSNRLDRLAAVIGGGAAAAYLNHVFFLELLQPPRGQFPETLVRYVLPIATAICAFGAAWLVARARKSRWLRRRRSARRGNAVVTEGEGI